MLIFDGLIAVPIPNTRGIIRDPMSAQIVLPVPLRYRHHEQVGLVTRAIKTPQGIRILGEVHDDAAVSYWIQDRVRSGKLCGLSVGPRHVVAQKIGKTILDWTLIEVSLTPMGANKAARVIKVHAAPAHAVRLADYI